MVSKYPISGRPRPRPDIPGPRPFKPHRPNLPGWPQRPIPKLPPVPKGAVTLATRIGRVGLKAIPYLGTALTVYEIYQWTKAMPKGMNFPANWELQCSHAPSCAGYENSPISHYYSFIGSPTCYRWCDQYITGLPELSVPVPANHTLVVKVHSWVNNNNWRATGETWAKIAPGAQPSYSPVELPGIYAPPEWMPGQPGVLPINKPAPQPKTAPRPLQRPKPGEQPMETKPEVGQPRPTSVPKPQPHVIPVLPYPVAVWPSPSIENPYYPVTPDIVIGGNTAPPQGGGRIKPWIRNEPNSGKNKPPNRAKREREKKLNIRTVGGIAIVGINSFTEAMDFIDVLAEALPKNILEQMRRDAKNDGYDYVPPQYKMKALYKNIHRIDIGNAVENYFNNEMEDLLFGIVGRNLGKASSAVGVTTGLNRALMTQTDGALSELVPHIDIDDETGQLSITVPAFGTVKQGFLGPKK